tara:strand:- start:92 stop:268 length:177 start_codon:yes stop_codon:yes gene_type:complete
VLLEVAEAVLDTLLHVEQLDVRELVEQVVVELVLKVIMEQQEQTTLAVVAVEVEEYAV